MYVVAEVSVLLDTKLGLRRIARYKFWDGALLVVCKTTNRVAGYLKLPLDLRIGQFEPISGPSQEAF